MNLTHNSSYPLFFLYVCVCVCVCAHASADLMLDVRRRSPVIDPGIQVEQEALMEDLKWDLATGSDPALRKLLREAISVRPSPARRESRALRRRSSLIGFVATGQPQPGHGHQHHQHHQQPTHDRSALPLGLQKGRDENNFHPQLPGHEEAMEHGGGDSRTPPSKRRVGHEHGYSSHLRAESSAAGHGGHPLLANRTHSHVPTSATEVEGAVDAGHAAMLVRRGQTGATMQLGGRAASSSSMMSTRSAASGMKGRRQSSFTDGGLIETRAVDASDLGSALPMRDWKKPGKWRR